MNDNTGLIGLKDLNIIPFVDIFDQALAKDDSRAFKERNYMYASELGTSFYDRYLSMCGVIPSNEANEIARRKFKIGKLIEDYFKLVLYMVGLLRSQETRVISNFETEIQVSGRLDVVYGGKWEIQNIDNLLHQLSFLSFIGTISDAIKLYADKHRDAVYSLSGLEIKSCSSQIYDRLMLSNRATKQHELQAFHYAYTLKIPFQIVYFDKNGARMMSFWIFPDDRELLKEYIDDVKMMSYYYVNMITPPKEKLIVINENGKFKENWQIQYSKYLSSEYGFEDKEDFVNKIKPIADRWNRVIERIESGKPMTEDNLKAIDEMNEAGFDIKKPITYEDVHHEVVNNEEPQKKLSSDQKLLLLKKGLNLS